LCFHKTIRRSRKIIKVSYERVLRVSEESKPPSVHSSIRLRAIPRHGWTPLLAFAIALCWLAPTGIHRFIHRCHCTQWQGIMRPQPSGIIALAYRGKRFCVRARTLALSHFGIRVSSGGGTFLTTCGRGGCSSSRRVRAVSWGLLPYIYSILKHKVRTREPDELPAPDNGMKE